MIESFLATLSSMVVMFLCMLIGFVLRKKGVLPDNTATVLSKLEVNVFLPALSLTSFIKYCTVETIVSQYDVILYGCVALAISLVIGSPLARLFSKERNEQNIYRYFLVIANYGYLGCALADAILGPEGLYLYMLFYMPLTVCVYTWGMNILIPQEKGQKTNMFKRLINPAFIAVIAGLVLGLTGLGKYMPGLVTTTLGNLANCMVPVSMLLAGVIIGGFPVKELLKIKKVYIVTFLRLLVLPAVTIFLLWLLGADKQVLVLTLFAFASALGLNTVVFPAAYGGDTRTGASMALISNVAAVITIPLMYSLLNML